MANGTDYSTWTFKPVGGAAPAPAGAAAPDYSKWSFKPAKGATPAAPQQGIVGKALSALPTDPFQQAAPSRQEMGTLPWLGERAVEVAGGGLGGLAGGAAGLLSPVPGGAFAGEALGSTAGLGLADIINNAINRHFFGKGADVSLSNVEQAAKANLAGSLIGGAAGKVLGPLVGRIAGRGGAEAAAKEAATAGEAEAGAAKEAMTAGQQALRAQSGEALGAAPGQIAKQILPDAEKEAMQRSLGRTVEESVAAQTLPPAAGGGPGPAMLARRGEFTDAMRGIMGLGSKQGALVSEDVTPEFWTRMQGITEPTDAMREISATPQRFLQIASRADPQQSSILRREFADAVNLGKIRPDETMRPALQQLGFKGVLVKPEAWEKADQTLAYLPDMLAQNPRALARYNSMLNQHIAAARLTENQGIIDLAQKQAAGLPAKTREGILNAIKAARTPEDQADAALQAFDAMNPQAAGQAKAVEAIMGYKPQAGFLGQMLKRRLRRGFLMPATLGIGAVMGHAGSPVAAATLGTLGIGMGIRAGLRKAFLYSIQHDEDAGLQFLRAINNPGIEDNFSRITRTVVDASMADVVKNQAGPRAPSEPADDEYDPSKWEYPPMITDRTSSPGPMGKQIEREQANQISTDRGKQDPKHIDEIQDLNTQLSKGKTPNIHHDLSAGRLSPEEIRKLVANDPATLNGMFQGMDLATAMQAFSQGTPEEKEMALAPLVQKLNDEGRNLDPAQRRALMAQLRRAMPGGDEQQPPDQQPMPPQGPQGMAQ